MKTFLPPASGLQILAFSVLSCLFFTPSVQAQKGFEFHVSIGRAFLNNPYENGGGWEGINNLNRIDRFSSLGVDYRLHKSWALGLTGRSVGLSFRQLESGDFTRLYDISAGHFQVNPHLE